MQEIHRILRPGGEVKVLVPYFANPHSYSDPTHKTWFTSRTFLYFKPGFYYFPDVGFEVVKRKIIMFSRRGFMMSVWWSVPFEILPNACLPVYERLFAYWLPAGEIHFLLRVVK